MKKVVGTADGPAGKMQEMLVAALQNALESAPAPSPGNDVQRFTLVTVEFQHGGFTSTTTTRVTLDVEDGPLPPA